MEIKIAIDAMGGDHGPQVTVAAALEFLRRHEDAHLILVGLPDAIQTVLSQAGLPAHPRLRIHPAREVVAMDESPALAMRNKKDSSMRVAINLVKDKEAAVCVSAGNTGALMAISRFVLKMLPGIERPAIASVLPTLKGHVWMLDLGANVDCTAEHLLQFGIMGATLVTAVEHIDTPSVGLLNIGEEDIKGNEVVGLVLTEHLSAQHPAIRVLILSMYDNPEYVSRAMCAGARGYVLKDAGSHEIIAAIDAVAAGGSYYSAGVAPIPRRPSGPCLSEREREVLILLAQGLSNKAIALQLDISVRTAETHRLSVRRKLEIDSAAGLAKFAIEQGWL